MFIAITTIWSSPGSQLRRPADVEVSVDRVELPVHGIGSRRRVSDRDGTAVGVVDAQLESVHLVRRGVRHPDDDADAQAGVARRQLRGGDAVPARAERIELALDRGHRVGDEGIDLHHAGGSAPRWLVMRP